MAGAQRPLTSLLRPEANAPESGRDTHWQVRTERIVFVVAAAAVIAHLVNHLLVGVLMDLQFVSVLAFGALTCVAALAYPRLPWRLQAAGSITLGVGWLVGDFVMHPSPRSATAPRRPT
jgi:hypothetical protein